MRILIIMGVVLGATLVTDRCSRADEAPVRCHYAPWYGPEAPIVTTVQVAAQPLVLIKDVPAHASLQYVISGSVIQSMSLQPGRWRVTIERVQ
jgi:hypothetical protein